MMRPLRRKQNSKCIQTPCNTSGRHFSDNSNLNFYLQRGDINAAAGNLTTAIGNYDEAIAKGKDDAEAWKARTATLIRLYEKKYGTDNAGQLKKKISASDNRRSAAASRLGRPRGLKDIRSIWYKPHL